MVLEIMVTIESKKEQIGLLISPEYYRKIKELCQGDDTPFTSISDYMTALVVADMARREMGGDDITSRFLVALESPEIKMKIPKIIEGTQP
ncbi:MAG: hypothetical protein PHV96_02570 [Methanocorpusculum sp.]|jgi:hypothetical protein|nr:hypothetical protein [Methanocorpusculum sp.]